MMKTAFLVAGVLSCVTPAWAGEADWIKDEGDVLEVKVALADKEGACGAILTLDRSKKTLSFGGAPGDIGCKLKLEATFEDVKSVKTGDGAGFLLELTKGKPKKLLMIPVPHVQWLLAQPMVSGGAYAEVSRAADMQNPGGMRTGRGGVGPRVERVQIPKEVAADTEKAVTAIRAALDQKTPPSRSK